MTKKTRLISMLLAIVVVVAPTFSVHAEESVQSTNENVTQIQSTSEGLPITTRDSDGNISESVYYPSNVLSTNMSVSDMVAAPYIVEFQDYELSKPGVAPMSLDDYGREKASPANGRVGYLECKFDSDGDGIADTTTYGTASLQSYDILISCAHAVIKKQYASVNDGWAKSIRFYAGRTARGSYLSFASYTNVSVSTAYTSNTTVKYENGVAKEYPDFQNDWSIITIDMNFGSKFGWYGLHGCESESIGLDVTMEGYPSDKGSGYEQWRSVGKITSIDNQIMNTTLYNIGGFSGAPILYNGYVYGINTHVHGNSADRNSGGTRMYPLLFSYIVSARADSEERWKK